MNKIIVWFHFFPEKPEVIINNQLFEYIKVSVFTAANDSQRAEKLFSGNFNEFIDFISNNELSGNVEVLLPASEVLLTKVNIPSKSKKRILQALPFLLEDKLINTSDKQYFALGEIKSRECNIAVVSKYIVDTLYSQFKALSFPVSQMSSELFLLPWQPGQWSFAFLRNNILIRTGVQSGIAINRQNIDFVFHLILNNTKPDDSELLPKENAEDSSQTTETQDSMTGIPDLIRIYAEKNSSNSSYIESIVKIAQEYLIETDVIEGSLLKFALSNDNIKSKNNELEYPGINLLQGDYHPSNLKPVKIPFLKSMAAVLIIWLFSQLFFMGYQWNHYKNELSQLDTELQELYFYTFPNSKRIIDVRMQAQSQLKQLQKNSDAKSSFFSLLGMVGDEIYRNKLIRIEGLKFNDGILQLNLVSKGFIYNNLKDKLKIKYKLIVEERSSSKIKGEVHSVLNFKTSID